MDNINLDTPASDLGFVLKSEQKETVGSLLKGRDTFGVLPTGFGKSLIFQLLVFCEKQSFQLANCSFSRTADIYCPLSAGAALWNSLPCNLRTIKSFNQFKNKISIEITTL